MGVMAPLLQRICSRCGVSENIVEVHSAGVSDVEEVNGMCEKEVNGNASCECKGICDEVADKMVGRRDVVLGRSVLLLVPGAGTSDILMWNKSQDMLPWIEAGAAERKCIVGVTC